MSEMHPEPAPAASGTAPGRAAYEPSDREPLPSGLIPAERMALTVARRQLERGENPPVNITTVLVMAIDRLLTTEAVAAMAETRLVREQLAAVQRERDYLRERFLWYENDRDKWREAAGSVTAERDEARGQLAAVRERLTALTDKLELSANASHPSKKSEIERQCAQAVRAIAEGIRT